MDHRYPEVQDSAENKKPGHKDRVQMYSQLKIT